MTKKFNFSCKKYKNNFYKPGPLHPDSLAFVLLGRPLVYWLSSSQTSLHIVVFSPGPLPSLEQSPKHFHMSICQTEKNRKIETICPIFAIFLMSAMIFFSDISSRWRSRSSSRIALFSARWFCRNSSWGVLRLPNKNSMLGPPKKRQIKQNYNI